MTPNRNNNRQLIQWDFTHATVPDGGTSSNTTTGGVERSTREGHSSAERRNRLRAEAEHSYVCYLVVHIAAADKCDAFLRCADARRRPSGTATMAAATAEFGCSADKVKTGALPPGTHERADGGYCASDAIASRRAVSITGRTTAVAITASLTDTRRSTDEVRGRGTLRAAAADRGERRATRDYNCVVEWRSKHGDDNAATVACDNAVVSRLRRLCCCCCCYYRRRRRRRRFCFVRVFTSAALLVLVLLLRCCDCRRETVILLLRRSGPSGSQSIGVFHISPRECVSVFVLTNS